MINYCASFDPLLKQLQDYGIFSNSVPANSPGVKEISDYMFSELLSGIKQKRFAHSGILFDINCHQYNRISISTILTFNCSHIKSFLMTKPELESFSEYLDQLAMVYTHLFIQHPRYDFQTITVLYREKAS